MVAMKMAILITRRWPDLRIIEQENKQKVYCHFYAYQAALIPNPRVNLIRYHRPIPRHVIFYVLLRIDSCI